MRNINKQYNMYNVHNSAIPEGEGPQCFNVGGCLPLPSHPKQLVPTHKQIGFANENL